MKKASENGNIFLVCASDGLKNETRKRTIEIESNTNIILNNEFTGRAVNFDLDSLSEIRFLISGVISSTKAEKKKSPLPTFAKGEQYLNTVLEISPPKALSSSE